jgi:hypothetical protein
MTVVQKMAEGMAIQTSIKALASRKPTPAAVLPTQHIDEAPLSPRTPVNNINITLSLMQTSMSSTMSNP